jgi:hypothetical protein
MNKQNFKEKTKSWLYPTVHISRLLQYVANSAAHDEGINVGITTSIKMNLFLSGSEITKNEAKI